MILLMIESCPKLMEVLHGPLFYSTNPVCIFFPFFPVGFFLVSKEYKKGKIQQYYCTKADLIALYLTALIVIKVEF